MDYNNWQIEETDEHWILHVPQPAEVKTLITTRSQWTLAEIKRYIDACEYIRTLPLTA